MIISVSYIYALVVCALLTLHTVPTEHGSRKTCDHLHNEVGFIMCSAMALRTAEFKVAKCIDIVLVSRKKSLTTHNGGSLGFRFEEERS